MCGIAGIFLAVPNRDAAGLSSITQAMGDAIIARGPDDGGLWVDAEQGIGLAHRRLSIIDLSPEGHQPMVSASGRYVLSFNGEIYNYRDLRAQLDYPWRGQSDTEVMLAAFEAWGIEKSLSAFNGMFGFAVWDRKERTLTLARDRMGEKPVYYGWVGDSFVFASELKAFRKIPGWPPSINRDALNLLMRFSYIPAPHSIYHGINKLPPATFVALRVGQKDLLPVPYWSYEAMVETCSSNRLVCSEQEATDELDRRLRFAVSQRMMADVPLGVFLSGGIDSSSIVALMQQQSSIPVRSFTIGFTEQGFDEAPYARAIARHLQTEHTEIYVSSREAAKVIEHLPRIYDEPFADSSQIPTHLVSKFARQHVTVALSGDGGDEMFGGYNRYVRGPALWRGISMVPYGLRRVIASGLMAAHGAIMPANPDLATTRAERFARKLRNYYDKMATLTPEEFYIKLCSIDDRPERVVIGGNRLELFSDSKRLGLDYAEWMMMQDALTYFPGDILTKVDRAAMAVGLETRTPFTDPEVMGLAWQLPLDMKIQQGKGKWLLRQVLYRYVPQHLIERPKAGFAVPIGSWLRGRLKPWAADLLAADRLRREGFFDADEVQRMWDAHQTGRRDKESQLWNVLMFQSWLDSVRNN